MSASRVQAVPSPVKPVHNDAVESGGKSGFEVGPFLWFAPALLILVLVTLYPSVFVMYLSFQKTRYYELTGFVGLANFVEVLSSSAFRSTTIISLLYVVGSLAGATILGAAAALVLNNAGL
ncbi:MAG: hypothetical protein ACJ8DW_09575, partial [Microvirga sp.]